MTADSDAAMNKESRRPLKTRSRTWAKKAAALLAGTNISPNQISVASVVVAAIGTASLLIDPNVIGLIICAICIQVRLLCNLLDGMVAIEGGKQSSLGMLYNEFPDRIADSLLIVALGYAISLPWIGWFGALAAMATAYIRVFGGALGLVQDFRGPMAKQHRMAVMTAGCLAGAIEMPIWRTNYALMIAAYVIMLGAAITCITRTIAIAKQLH
jgi:phosphatidylglycerophosphate synthase